METEPSAWLMKSREDDETHGIILTYVDDVLILSTKEVVEEWVDLIRRTWETSSPEWVNPDEPTRFLGMELKRSEEGIWTASQKNYTLEVLRKNLKKTPWPRKKIPISKEGAESEEEDQKKEEDEDVGPKTPAEVKEAQKVVGELIWLVTRCRPDLMYVTTKMASWSTRNPRKVLDMAGQVWGYLAGTVNSTLQLKGTLDSNDMEVHTDASYGDDAHGCVVVKWGEAAILWRSAKQTLQTTSTAEAELVEIMEGATMADSVRVVIEELVGERVRCWQFTDSASALSIVSGDSASWRTRHLRKRARFLRWRALRGDVVMRHQPGSEMVADIGTKALASVRLKELKGRLGLIEEEVEEAGDLQEVKKNAENCHMEKPQLVDQAQAERLVKVLMVMALVQRAKGAEEEEEDHRALECAILLYTIVVVVATVVSQALWKWWGRGHHPSNAQADSSATTDEMEEEAPLPALQRRASRAAHLASIVGSTTSGEVTGHRAGTNEPSTVSSATSQIPAPTQRGCSRNTDRTPEVTTSGQATPSEEPQASQQKNSGASRHQQVSTSDTASADKKISSQSPGET